MDIRYEVKISHEVIYTRLDEIRKSPADRQNARAALAHELRARLGGALRAARRRRENGAHG